MTHRTISATVLAALLVSARAFAADSWAPPTLKDPKVTLADAVRITLESNPTLRLAEQRALGQRGVFQIETGAFDPLVAGTGQFTFTQQSLTLPQIAAERKNREDIQGDIEDDEQDLALLEAEYEDLLRLQADPGSYQTSQVGLLGIQLQVNALNQRIALTTDPAQRAALIAQRNALIAAAVSDKAADVTGQQALLDRDRTRLAKLGEIPEIRIDESLDLSLELKFPYRDGVTAGLFANGSWTRARYKGKTKLTDEGGLGVEDLYTYDIGFSIDAALLRGRGRDATGAFETAARIDWEASRDALEHAAAQSVLETVTAYWNLAAAQELVAVTRRSAALHARRLEVTRALIQGDEIPKAELSRELAAQATDEALVQSAERAASEARLALARAMGILVSSEAEAPVAADPLPDRVDREALGRLVPEPLIRIALENRADRRSAERLRESGGVLLREAQTALRPRLDFSGRISAGTVAETSLARSSEGWSTPSFRLALDFEQPIGNNVARGRLLQQEADLAQRSIFAADLDRNIRASVVQAVATLRASGEQLTRVTQAVELYGKTIDAENERFRAGQSSLLDAIVTQDLQTNALFTLTTARQQFATLVARLRYETATLVLREGDRNVVRAGDLTTLPAAAK